MSAVWDSSDLILMGLGQESDRDGEVVSWEPTYSEPALNASPHPPLGSLGTGFDAAAVLRDPDSPPQWTLP